MGARSLVPLILLLVFVGILAAVVFVAYSIMQDVGKNTREKMERKHIALTKDGMKVQVKEVKDEAYKDRTQRCVDVPWCCFSVFSFPSSETLPTIFISTDLSLLAVFWSTCGITRPSLPIRVDSGICPVKPQISRVQISASSTCPQIS